MSLQRATRAIIVTVTLKNMALHHFRRFRIPPVFRLVIVCLFLADNGGENLDC
jgi:hypothetical protein